MSALWAFVIGVCAGTVVMYGVMVWVIMRETRRKCEIIREAMDFELAWEEGQRDLELANELIDHYRQAVGNERIRDLH